MRRTVLKRVSAGMVGLLLLLGAGLGLLRVYVLQPPQAEAGAALFAHKGCGQCHHTNSRATKVGPGLQGLFDRERLPMSGRPLSEENVRKQLVDPYRNMPSFADKLTAEQIEKLIAYLKAL